MEASETILFLKKTTKANKFEAQCAHCGGRAGRGEGNCYWSMTKGFAALYVIHMDCAQTVRAMNCDSFGRARRPVEINSFETRLLP